MEEKYDEFFCGEATEEPIILTENAVLDCGQNSRRSRLILKAINELEEEVSDAKFAELWESARTLSYAIRSLEEHMGQTIDSYLFNAIHNRVLNLRSKGVKLKQFTI
tara:strand:+ start:22650 stop:22970 length:321 start_codon:yes stop_codon:yes gene_type:complete